MSDEKRPINVTSFNQQGGITAYNVNVGATPRHLEANLASQLTRAIPRDKKVNVTCIMGDGEGLQFASEIKNHLIAEGYRVDGVDQAIFAQPVIGQIIEQGPEQYRVVIGTRQQ